MYVGRMEEERRKKMGIVGAPGELLEGKGRRQHPSCPQQRTQARLKLLTYYAQDHPTMRVITTLVKVP